MKNINNEYSEYFKNENIETNSAVSSYAIIPHYYQLDMLLNEFNFNPDIQITIYDQRIGDDLYRYNIF